MYKQKKESKVGRINLDGLDKESELKPQDSARMPYKRSQSVLKVVGSPKTKSLLSSPTASIPRDSDVLGKPTETLSQAQLEQVRLRRDIAEGVVVDSKGVKKDIVPSMVLKPVKIEDLCKTQREMTMLRRLRELQKAFLRYLVQKLVSCLGS